MGMIKWVAEFQAVAQYSIKAGMAKEENADQSDHGNVQKCPAYEQAKGYCFMMD